MKRIISIIYIFMTILVLLFLITAIGLIHRWINPEMKSISLTDIKQLGLVIGVNVILLVFTNLYFRQRKNIEPK